MSRMLSKMNLISVVQQLPKEDIETIQGYVEMIEEENQKLKLQLSGTTFCYDEEEHRELKKQLEEINKMIEKCGFANIEQVILNYCGLLIQQKKFIKYMNSCIKELEKENQNKLQNTINLGITDITKIILQKYKEIIGVDK